MFKITARTVLELGSELISSDVIAFYELIKNGFDAHTSNGVEIKFSIVMRRNSYLSLRTRAAAGAEELLFLTNQALAQLNVDAPFELLETARSKLSKCKSHTALVDALDAVNGLSTIEVSDSGSGMSLEEVSTNFLVIGTASRKKKVDAALARGDAKSPYLGEKGIGRLSTMRLGERLRVETARTEDVELNCLDIDWADFAKLDAMLDQISVEPYAGGEKLPSSWSGTRIIIGSLSEDWTQDRVKRMAESDFSRLTDPFLDPKNRPRVALIWNGERVSIPWMPQALLGNAHASANGAYEFVEGKPQLRCTVTVSNLGFKHPVETENYLIAGDDLISALIGASRELPESALTSIGPFGFETHWFNRRLLSAIEGVGDLRIVREQQQRWSGILLFRDGFRVFPYGEDEDDWLGLDRRALGRSGYTLNKAQFIGRVNISRIKNPFLLDQTNREGLRETPEQQVFVSVMQHVIQDLLFRTMKNVEKQYKGQKVDLTEAKTEVDNLNARSKSALVKLRKLVLAEGEDAIEDLQQTLFEFADFAERARKRIEEVEHESRQMIEMAGVGLMVEVVAHELARASENALENLEALRGKNIPEDVNVKLASLRAQMKSLGKRVRVLDPLSVAGRQRVESFDLKELVHETLEAHEGQFRRHNITMELNAPSGPIQVRTVKGMFVQVLENLISNSKYWMDIKANKPGAYTPTIKLTLMQTPPTIIFEDNGPGISEENKERVFRAFFSLKEKTKRRGLGLFIARECAEYVGGSLSLDASSDSEPGRLNRFTLELPALTRQQ